MKSLSLKKCFHFLTKKTQWLYLTVMLLPSRILANEPSTGGADFFSLDGTEMEASLIEVYMRCFGPIFLVALIVWAAFPNEKVKLVGKATTIGSIVVYIVCILLQSGFITNTLVKFASFFS